MLEPLPLLALERLALKLIPVEASAGTEIIRQGDSGDRYYVVAAGELDAALHGHAVSSMGRGDGSARSHCSATFRVPRPSPPATTRSCTPSSAEAAQSVVTARLSSVLGAA